MNIENTNDEIVKQLRLHNISTKMRSLESSDWIVYETVDNEIVGAVGISGLFHSSSIQIHEKFRNKGLGQELLGQIVHASKSMGCKKIFLEVRISNNPAIELYNKSGFKRVSIRKNYYRLPDGREDALVMSKRLKKPWRLF